MGGGEWEWGAAGKVRLRRTGWTQLSLTSRDKVGQPQKPACGHELCQAVFTLADAKQVDLGALHKSCYFYLGSVLLQ